MSRTHYSANRTDSSRCSLRFSECRLSAAAATGPSSPLNSYLTCCGLHQCLAPDSGRRRSRASGCRVTTRRRRTRPGPRLACPSQSLVAKSPSSSPCTTYHSSSHCQAFEFFLLPRWYLGLTASTSSSDRGCLGCLEANPGSLNRLDRWLALWMIGRWSSIAILECRAFS